jgi:hypothetical protein
LLLCLTLAELRQRFSDLGRLPSVDQAQAMQRARSAARERQRASREFSLRRKSSPEALQRWKHGGGDHALSGPHARTAGRKFRSDDAAAPIPVAGAGDGLMAAVSSRIT